MARTLVSSSAKGKAILTMNLEEKVLQYIKEHPGGVRISDMEKPLGEMRMKLGYIANKLYDEEKVKKIEQKFYPLG